MKKLFSKTKLVTFALAWIGICPAGWSQGPVLQTSTGINTDIDGAKFSAVAVDRLGDNLKVTMEINLSEAKMKGHRVVAFVPFVSNGSDTLFLKPVCLYSASRWIQYRRQGQKPLFDSDEIAYKYSERPQSSFIYSESLPYQEWMNGSVLDIKRNEYGCCRTLIAAGTPVEVGEYRMMAFEPELKYVRPVAHNVKQRSLEGAAYIDFPVNQTVIYPDYRRNASELDSIRRTIDVVRLDPDATIETVWLKGFASPESPYSHNADLARGRTAALKDYLLKLYNFNGAKMLTEYEPEDWVGLREFVVGSNLANRDGILEVIDSNLEPDPKEARIKSLYPEDYKFMLQNFYPALRHTNYRVNYVVRSYSDPQEILEIMKTRPGNLDLNEFYIAASALEPGSDEYNEVFETAVRLYPNDETANLNAANAALQRGDLILANKYLAKAGKNADADYARSILAVYNGDFEGARNYIEKAVKAGINATADEVRHIQDYINYSLRK